MTLRASEPNLRGATERIGMVFLFSAKNKDQDLPRAALAMQHEEGV